MTLDNQSTSLLPFQGLRFRPDLSDTLGPPTDIDSTDEARAVVAGRPHNAVRLEVEDDSDRLTFSTARALLDAWREGGVLVADPAPAYYVHEQEFELDGRLRVRRGVFGLVPLDVSDAGVLPHEETWEDNRRRRLQLLRDLDAGISPVYLIYEGRETARRLRDLARREPDVVTHDAAGFRHRLWVVSAPDEVAAVADAMRRRQFVIADGHHRFAAAQAFHAERRSPESAVFLACCVEAGDPGVVIRAIHRVVDLPDSVTAATLIATLERWFWVNELPLEGLSGGELVGHLPGGEFPSIGLVADHGSRFFVARLRDWETAEACLLDSIPDAVRRLDVTVLTELILRRALAISADDEAARVAYVHDPSDVLALARDSDCRLALLVRPIRLDQVMRVARAEGVVPVKSTSFVPKLPVGLAFHMLRA